MGFDSWRKSLDTYGDAMVLLDIDSYLNGTTTVSTYVNFNFWMIWDHESQSVESQGGSLSTRTVLWGALRCRLADTSVTSATAAFAVDNVSVPTATTAFVDDDVSSDCVDHVPPAWGSPARDAPCLGMPPLPQAGDGPPSSEGC